MIVRFLRDENGGAAIEYTLVLAGIAFAVISSVPSLAAKMNEVFGTVRAALQ